MFQTWKVSETEIVRILPNQKASKIIKKQKMVSESPNLENVRIGLLQNIAILKDILIFKNCKMSESKNVRIFQNRKMSESFKTRILQN